MIGKIIDILSGTIVSGKSVDVMRKGLALTRNQYCKIYFCSGILYTLCDWKKLQNLHQDGYTIRIRNLSQPTKTELSKSFEFSLDKGAVWNLYLTKAGESGLASHFDPHDVTAVQLYGQKTWHINKISSKHLTLNYNRFVPRAALINTTFTYSQLHTAKTEPNIDLHLKTGDLHRVEAITDSAHIAMHQKSLTINDLISYYFYKWLEKEKTQTSFSEFLMMNFKSAQNYSRVIDFFSTDSEIFKFEIESFLDEKPSSNNNIIALSRIQSDNHFSRLGKCIFPDCVDHSEEINFILDKLDELKL